MFLCNVMLLYYLYFAVFILFNMIFGFEKPVDTKNNSKRS